MTVKHHGSHFITIIISLQSCRQKCLVTDLHVLTSCTGVTGVDLAGLLGGRMASAEGGSVPSVMGYGEGCPLSSRLRGPAENGFWRILKATERSFLYLYDKIGGGAICISVPPLQILEGTCPPVPP